MKKIIILLICCLGLSLYESEAQTSNIFGQVFMYNAETGELELPCPGMYAIVKGTQIGCAFDIDGKFILRPPQWTSVIQISYIGFITVEIEAYKFRGSSYENPYQIIMYEQPYERTSSYLFSWDVSPTLYENTICNKQN